MLLTELLMENDDLRMRLIALQAKLPPRYRDENGNEVGRNNFFADWLAKQPDDQLDEIKDALEARLTYLQANPKAKLPALVNRRPRKQQTTLNTMLQRTGPRFMRWLHELYDEPDELQQCQADPTCMLDTFEDYLRDELGIDVRRDGLITFWQLVQDTERLIGDLPVALYHFTSSRVVRSIRADGLEGDRDPINDRKTDGVYLTTEQSGPAVQGYLWGAIQAHGGHGVMLTIKCYLRELMADPDDADISSGRTQFVMNYVQPDRIVSVERSSA